MGQFQEITQMRICLNGNHVFLIAIIIGIYQKFMSQEKVFSMLLSLTSIKSENKLLFSSKKIQFALYPETMPIKKYSLHHWFGN